MIQQKGESNWREFNKFTVTSVVFYLATFPCRMKDLGLSLEEIPLSKTFIFIKLGCQQNLLELGFFEFLKQTGSVFKGESANVSKN